MHIPISKIALACLQAAEIAEGIGEGEAQKLPAVIITENDVTVTVQVTVSRQSAPAKTAAGGK